MQTTDSLYECLLEDIIRQILIVNHEKDVREQFHLVAWKQQVKGSVVAPDLRQSQLFVCHIIEFSHFLNHIY